MKFNIGDPVMYCTYGLGQVIGIEEQDVYGKNNIVKGISINDLTAWVPNDENVGFDSGHSRVGRNGKVRAVNDGFSQ